MQRNWNICIKSVPILRKSEWTPSEHTSAMEQHFFPLLKSLSFLGNTPDCRARLGKTGVNLVRAPSSFGFALLKSLTFRTESGWYFNTKIITVNGKDQRKNVGHLYTSQMPVMSSIHRHCSKNPLYIFLLYYLNIGNMTSASGKTWSLLS